MHLGWKVLLPVALAYVILVATAVLLLDAFTIEGFAFGALLTGVSGLATLVFVFLIDRDRIITGAAAPRRIPGNTLESGGRPAPDVPGARARRSRFTRR